MRPWSVTALLLASVLAAACSRAPAHEFPLVQKHDMRPGDVFYFRPSDGRFVAFERRDALTVAIAPTPRISARAYDSRIFVGRSQDATIVQTVFVQDTTPQRALALTADGRLLAGGDEFGALTLWNVESGAAERQWRVGAPILSAAFSPDGTRLAIGVETLGKPLATVQLWDVRGPNNAVRSLGSRDAGALAWSPDGRVLAVGQGNGSVVVAEAAGTEASFELKSSTAAVTSVDFHPSGTFLAAAHADKHVRLWKLPKGELVFTFVPELPADPLFPRGIERVAFDTSGTRMAVIYADGDARIWNTSALKPGQRQ